MRLQGYEFGYLFTSYINLHHATLKHYPHRLEPKLAQDHYYQVTLKS